jgi:hypothetical protein
MRPTMDEPNAVPACEGWLDVSTPDGRSFTRLYAALEPESRLLIFFSSENKEAGSERAVVDMLSAALFPELPPIHGAPQPPTPSSPAFWLQVEEDGIFGPGPGRVAVTALVAESPEDLERWIGVLDAACDAQTMRQQTEEEKAGAPVLSTTLLHQMKNAGFFNSLGSVLERKVIVHPASKTLTVYTDAGGSKAAAVLRLSAAGVKFDFRCDEKSPQRNFGNLKVEIEAPIVGGKEGQRQVHVFRTHTHTEFTSWAAALAAL